MNPTQTCSTCRYFNKRAGQRGGTVQSTETLKAITEPNTEIGECRRNAPRPNNSGEGGGAAWPGVDGTDWCGEWASADHA
jgi:hypothetical protein